MSVCEGERIRKRDQLKSLIRPKKQDVQDDSLDRTETQQIDEIIESSVPDIVQPQCMLFPTYACQVENNLYKVTLAGWAFAKPGVGRLDRFLLGNC